MNTQRCFRGVLVLMSSHHLRTHLQTATIWLSLCAITFAQTPAPTPQNPAQQDATRPPGTQQQQTNVPDQARPSSDPTRPPGTQQTSPQTPPGTARPPATQQPTPSVTTPAPMTGVPPVEQPPAGEQPTNPDQAL